MPLQIQKVQRRWDKAPAESESRCQKGQPFEIDCARDLMSSCTRVKEFTSQYLTVEACGLEEADRPPAVYSLATAVLEAFASATPSAPPVAKSAAPDQKIEVPSWKNREPEKGREERRWSQPTRKNLIAQKQNTYWSVSDWNY